jgi:hypothetical protein
MFIAAGKYSYHSAFKGQRRELLLVPECKTPASGTVIICYIGLAALQSANQ